MMTTQEMTFLNKVIAFEGNMELANPLSVLS